MFFNWMTKKHFILGLWFIDETSVLYLQEIHVTYWCSMTFKWYPMDTQICKFKIGSFTNDQTTMIFHTKKLSQEKLADNAVLDYSVEVTIRCLFTNILWAHFLYKSVLHSFSLIAVLLCYFLAKEYWHKRCLWNVGVIDHRALRCGIMGNVYFY